MTKGATLRDSTFEHLRKLRALTGIKANSELLDSLCENAVKALSDRGAQAEDKWNKLHDTVEEIGFILGESDLIHEANVCFQNALANYRTRDRMRSNLAKTKEIKP